MIAGANFCLLLLLQALRLASQQIATANNPGLITCIGNAIDLFH
ncbi:Uncharacterized protein YR821_2698 [Yersinia ruckeri]|uniref:Uncharacterized protein n=1 Tax=Yersinia ruckeri TaxID=29486 RepID=A0A0A8VJG8_YERRU|nr:hypothetical protein yruck0001_5990 [Yersinia ruckeri ATCC 29473]QTD77615.1 Uncharacterized protein YR821_2698 [Yersinia ruckeri]CEK28538.1 hypothetical protein CSF007_14030 [Yersinia ruckeri]